MRLTEKLSLATKVVQCPGNFVSDMDGEKVMLNIENGKYYNLGSSGGEIWGLLEQKMKIETLVETLLLEYEVERSLCERQVLAFIQSLYKEGLVEVCE